MKRALVLTPVVAMLLAGCGSSSSSSSKSASTVARPSPTPAAGGPVVVTKKDMKLGTILAAGPKKVTVYVFEADKGSTSKCSGACAAAWPPVIATGTPTVGGRAQSSALGTTKRADGTQQVTYKGHPIYYFIKDKDSGDAYGQKLHQFGADWYVLGPSGNKIG